jgi:hypothetical protein
MVRTFVYFSMALLLTASWAVGQAPQTGGQAVQQVQPAQPGQAGQAQYQQGRIVRVNPDQNTVVIRGAGPNARDQEYKINNDTRYYGTDN